MSTQVKATGSSTEPARAGSAPPSPSAAAAPSATNSPRAGAPPAATAPGPAPEPEGEPTTRERIVDALRYLGDGQMPWAAIGGTIAFPLVLAFGAMLRAFGDNALLRCVALVPALYLLAMVGVVCRQVLLGALSGLDEAEDLPVPGRFARQACGLLPQVAALGGTFLGPGAAALELGWWSSALLLLAAGLFLLPMAGALLVTTNCWRALSPAVVLTAIRRVGRPYLRTIMAIALLVIPAICAFVLTIGLPAYTLMAAVGPLSVVPALMAARMLGLVLEQGREALLDLLPLPGTAGTEPHTVAPAAPVRAKPPAPKRAAARLVEKPKLEKPAAAQPAAAKPAAAQPAPAQPAPAQKPAAAKPAAPNKPVAGNRPAAPNMPATVNKPAAANMPSSSKPAAPAKPAAANKSAAGNPPVNKPAPGS